MLKKITRKQDQKIEAAARAQFATDIIDLYRARMAGQPATHPDAEVREVAFGLVALKQAIEPFLHKHRNDPQALIYTGALVADGIIDALTTGRDHPLWKHIGALQTATYRPGAPGAYDQQRRAMFAGVVLAYQETAGVSRTKASIAVCEGIKAKDFPVTPGQLRKWIERNDKAARTYADRFLADAADVPDRYSETERILIAGREAMFPLLVVPS
jgi:hypothetical protein